MLLDKYRSFLAKFHEDYSENNHNYEVKGFQTTVCWIKSELQRLPLLTFYGLSDPSLADHFFLFFYKKVCVYHPNLAFKEHHLLYVYTYFLSQLCEMSILPIRSHCKISPLRTVQKWAISHGILLWAPYNAQNQHFTELRKKVCVDTGPSAPKRLAKFG